MLIEFSEISSSYNAKIVIKFEDITYSESDNSNMYYIIKEILQYCVQNNISTIEINKVGEFKFFDENFIISEFIDEFNKIKEHHIVYIPKNCNHIKIK